MIDLLIEIRDLFQFQIKQAARHAADEIKVTVPRAQYFLNKIDDFEANENCDDDIYGTPRRPQDTGEE